MKTKIFSSIAFLSLVVRVCAENLDSNPYTAQSSNASSISVIESKETDTKSHKIQSHYKAMPYANCYAPYVLSFMPGVGVSLRSDHLSLDLSANKMKELSAFTASGSIVGYFNPNKKKFYYSTGFGGFAIIENKKLSAYGPSMPLRIGQEFKAGFWDIGLNVGVMVFRSFPLFLPYAAPEVRVGVKF